jgi:hypothetical protein
MGAAPNMRREVLDRPLSRAMTETEIGRAQSFAFSLAH